MDISAPTPPPGKKRGRPSKKDAEEALNLIKAAEKEKDESDIKKKEEEEKLKEIARLEAIEKAKIEEAQLRIKRKLREQLKAKEEEQARKNNKDYLESSTGKIKWVSINSGNTLQGFFNKKLIFEIKKGATIFNLYIKNKDLMKSKKITKSYLGCSLTIKKLKEQSEKLI